MSNNRDEQVEERVKVAKEQVIGAIAETMDLYGVTPSAGTLYATMFFSKEMNLDEMREELEMSKPSMSTGVRRLQESGFVKRIYQRGSRKHVYVAEKDFFESFMVFYSKMWERESRMNMHAIAQSEKEFREVIETEDITDELAAEVENYLKLLDHSKKYYQWLKRLAESVRSEAIFDFIPK